MAKQIAQCQIWNTVSLVTFVSSCLHFRLCRNDQISLKNLRMVVSVLRTHLVRANREVIIGMSVKAIFEDHLRALRHHHAFIAHRRLGNRSFPCIAWNFVLVWNDLVGTIFSLVQISFLFQRRTVLVRIMLLEYFWQAQSVLDVNSARLAHVCFPLFEAVYLGWCSETTNILIKKLASRPSPVYHRPLPAFSALQYSIWLTNYSGFFADNLNSSHYFWSQCRLLILLIFYKTTFSGLLWCLLNRFS